MKKYPKNSLQSFWRIMTIMAAADGEITAEELGELAWTREQHVEEVFGKLLPQQTNLEVISETLDEWNAIADGDGDGSDYVRQAAKEITDRKKQKFTFGSIYNIASADDEFHETEVELLTFLCEIWGYDQEDVNRIMENKNLTKKQFEELFDGITVEVTRTYL
jgi:uncharacterized protein YecA (UPF0149 family)